MLTFPSPLPCCVCPNLTRPFASCFSYSTSLISLSLPSLLFTATLPKLFQSFSSSTDTGDAEPFVLNQPFSYDAFHSSSVYLLKNSLHCFFYYITFIVSSFLLSFLSAYTLESLQTPSFHLSNSTLPIFNALHYTPGLNSISRDNYARMCLALSLPTFSIM